MLTAVPFNFICLVLYFVKLTVVGLSILFPTNSVRPVNLVFCKLTSSFLFIFLRTRSPQFALFFLLFHVLKGKYVVNIAFVGLLNSLVCQSFESFQMGFFNKFLIVLSFLPLSLSKFIEFFTNKIYCFVHVFHLQFTFNLTFFCICCRSA